MKIKYHNEENGTLFDDLSYGDVFGYSEIIFIKVRKFSVPCGVRLHNGDFMEFGPTDMVIRYPDANLETGSPE